MLNPVGRIIARGDVVGLFLPARKGPKLDGIYEVQEGMGEFLIKRIGKPAMKEEFFHNADLSGLFLAIPSSFMTLSELAKLSTQQTKKAGIFPVME